MRLASGLMVACVVLVMAGCAGSDPATITQIPSAVAGTPVENVADIEGRTFVSVAVIGAMLPDPPVEIGFSRGMIVADVGCNVMSGEYAIAGRTLQVADAPITAAGCGPRSGNSDVWLRNLIKSGPTMRLDGDTLVVTGSTITLTLRDREVAVPAPPLVGTFWSLDSVLQGDTAIPVTSDDPWHTSFVIEDQGEALRLMGHTGCQNFGVPVEVGAAELTFGEPLMIGMACEGDDATAGQAMVAVVTAPTVSYELDGRRLTLRTPDGNGLRLKAMNALR